MNINELTGEVIGAAIEVHKAWVLAYWNRLMKNAYAMRCI